MFGGIARFGAKALGGIMAAGRGATGAVLSAPGVRSAVKSTAIGALTYGAGEALFGSKGGGGGLPALPGMPGGFPATMGDRGIFRNDPNLPDNLKGWAISKANLKAYYRAPKGFVIVYDSAGDPYGLPRKLAIMLKLWRPGHKPPISVGDYMAVKRADRTVKKFRKIYSMVARVDKNIGKGGKIKVPKKAGK